MVHTYIHLNQPYVYKMLLYTRRDEQLSQIHANEKTQKRTMRKKNSFTTTDTTTQFFCYIESE